MGVTLTGFGGVEEIGGNAFLLDDGRSRILLDVGKRFGSDKLVESHGAKPGWNDYFDEYLRPRTFRYVPDLLALGLVPNLLGLYRQDLGGDGGPTALDGVVVSHAHMDHAGLLGLLRPEIPVLASADSQAILHSIQETGAASPETEFVSTKAKGVGRTKGGDLTTHPRFADGPARRFDNGRGGDTGSWEVEHFAVDHSIPGARATILSGPDATVAYTGDFRLHGRSRHLTEKFLERAGGIQVLVTEGTNVHGPADGGHAQHKSTDHEATVEGQVEDAVRAEESRPGRTGFVGISYPPRDLDRFYSIWQVARRLGRRFVISPRQAHLIEGLRAAGRTELPDPRVDLSLAVHFEAAGKGLILGESSRALRVAARDLTLEEAVLEPEEFRTLLESDYRDWAIPFLRAPTRVSAAEIGRAPSGFLFSISFWSITELLDIFPDHTKANGLYIHSQTQPFNDEMLLDGRKLDRWLRRYSLDKVATHVSGHLGDADLSWAIDEVRPRLLVPVHTLAAATTAERYRARSGHRAALPVWGKPLDLARPPS
ncbi:MAG TPA: MBL fold metallo-hydrolase [Candidatus Thermoplasmatota archaeon]|nr:MBL fold metallo-hydrolase [Candidatus Thermoplasmatota archaeon]